MRGIVRKLSKGCRLLGDPRFRSGLFQGVAATVEHEAALSPYPFESVVDVGANRGQFTLFMAGLRPGIVILAFEPLIEPYEKLIDVTTRLSNVHAFHAAIGPLRGSLPMNVSRRDDSSSLLPITDLQEQIFPDTGYDRTVDVRIAPLADFLDQIELPGPRLLKIDVQGYELEVLRGAENHLRLFDVVYVEASFMELYERQPLADEVIDALHAAQFRLAGVHNLAKAKDGRAVQADFLFERR